MNISLTPELEKYVNSKVKSGLYQTASEVIREGLRLLKEKDELHQRKISELQSAIQKGIDQGERGQVSPFNEKTLKEAQTRGQEKLTARRRPRP